VTYSKRDAASQIVASQKNIHDLRDKIMHLPDCDRLRVRGWIVIPTNRVNYVGATITSKAQLQALSQEILSYPLSVDQARTTIDWLRPLRIQTAHACKVVPQLIFEMDKGTAREQIVFESKYIAHGHGNVHDNSSVPAEYILDVFGRTSIGLDKMQ
jgi:hypothetical protein